MIFGRKKASNLDRRLQELQREMAKVNSELNSLARSKKAGVDAHGLSAGGARFAAAEPGKTSAAEAPVSAGVKSVVSGTENQVAVSQAADSLNPGLTSEITGGTEGDMPLFERYSPLSTEGRQKFANYFMAGHFKNLRPLRQDRRIVRNKAIIMIILVVLALIWLFFFIYRR